jgi:hypothetical protein
VLGGARVPDAVLATAIRAHTLAAGSAPIENLAIVQVRRASAVKARERMAKGATDDDARVAALFAGHLDVSTADAANGVEERVGVAWRGLERGRDGTARDVRESAVATRFRGGLWSVAGYLLTDAGEFAGRGDHAGTYRAEDRSARGSFRCELDLAPAAAHATFRGTYRCAGRYRNYTYEPYRDMRYDGTIEEFVELAWTPAWLSAARSGPGSCCVEAFFITRSATGDQALVPVAVRKDGAIHVRWNPPSRREQGPSRTSSMRLTFQETATTSGGGR